MTNSSATGRLRQLVAEERWAVAERLLEHLDQDRMIVIDRARAAAIPRHAAERTDAARHLLAAIATAGHDVAADPAAELVAAITRRDVSDLPTLLATLRIPYGQPLPATPKPQRVAQSAPPRAPDELHAPAVVVPPPIGRAHRPPDEGQVIVAVADPRPPHDTPLGPAGQRQTTAQHPDGTLLELPDELDDPRARDALRAQCAAGTLTCPVAGCPAPLLVLRAGTVVRPHFAHRPNSGIRHDPADAWALRALAGLKRAEQNSDAGSAGSSSWTTDSGSLRLVGPNGRLGSIADEDVVVLATSHIRFAYRARLADGTWTDLLELPAEARHARTVRAVDHHARHVWFVSAHPPRASRRGLSIPDLPHLRSAVRIP